MAALAIGSGSVRLVADDAPSADSESPMAKAAAPNLVGCHVKVELRKGKPLENVIVEKVQPGKIPGTVASLWLRHSETEPGTLWGAGTIATVLLDGRAVLAFDETTKSLASPDPDRLSTIHKAAGKLSEKPAAAAMPKPKPKKKKDTVKDRAAKTKRKDNGLYTDEELSARANDASRFEYYRKTGVWLWEEVTEEVHKKELAKRKEYLQEVAAHFPSLPLQLHETEYYLFLSDFPPLVAKEYTSCLDKMHDQLCQAYAIKNKDGVWLGKLPVVAFVSNNSFVEFERAFFNHVIEPITGPQGIEHGATNGNVVVSCWAGPDPNYFASVLVHESTHGFNHRFKSGVRYPSWLDEGMADWTAMNVVRNNKLVVLKIKMAVVQAKQQGNLGGNFFTAKQIEPWQYGIASSMVDFLIKGDGRAFRNFLIGIKSGEKWQNALQKCYGVTPEELTAAYGASMGIPSLQP